jgi:hypothetical protein
MMEEKKFIVPALALGFLIRLNPNPTILVVTQELNDIVFGFVALVAYRLLEKKCEVLMKQSHVDVG